ncbi:MAG: serine hydrolase domain-containing protein [Caulobacterales bacterium]
MAFKVHAAPPLAGPAGETFSEWLQAYNDADPAALQAFMTSRSRVPSPAEFWAGINRTAGPLSVDKAEAVGRDTVTAVVEDHWGRFGEISLKVAPEPPFQIIALDIKEIFPPEDKLPTRMDWSQLRSALRARLADDVANDWFSGAVVVSKAGRPLFKAAYGSADRERKLPNTLETRFRVGSINKMITAVAVLQLNQAGKIGLDDAVGRYLPDYPSRLFAEKVTVRQLLSHMGGAGDIFGPEFEKHRLELRDPKDYVALYGRRDPEFEPGSRHSYANYGFIVLGRIVETVSGRSYDDYVQGRIFGPAGMTATGALPETIEVPGRSIGYMDSPGGLVRSDASPFLLYRGTPAGGGYSTVGDLVRFADTLTSGQLLDPEHLRMLTTGVVEGPLPGPKYAMGCIEFFRTGVRCFYHAGSAPGMCGSLMIFPDAGYVVAVLSNRDPPQGWSLANFISDRLPAR